MNNRKIKVEGNIYSCGVYGLYTIDKNELLYVGSSKEMNDSLSRHLYYLRRGLYDNKPKLQSAYDNDNLYFKAIQDCTGLSDIEISKIEEDFIASNHPTVMNVQMSVSRHSSNKSAVSSFKRRLANSGINNPNCKTDFTIIGEILWLKINAPDVSINEISKHYDMPYSYVFRIGYDRWLTMQPIKPEWYEQRTA